MQFWPFHGTREDAPRSPRSAVRSTPGFRHTTRNERDPVTVGRLYSKSTLEISEGPKKSTFQSESKFHFLFGHAVSRLVRDASNRLDSRVEFVERNAVQKAASENSKGQPSYRIFCKCRLWNFTGLTFSQLNHDSTVRIDQAAAAAAAVQCTACACCNTVVGYCERYGDTSK